MAQPHPLDIIDHKLERALQILSELQQEVERVLQSAPYTTITDEDVEELADFQRMLSAIPVSPRVSILAGEVLYHCRSVLDHLAAALVRINKGTVTKQTQFPIFLERPTKDQAKTYANHVQGMTDSAKEMIALEQPFDAKSPEDHPLALLKMLNDFDKHQALLVAVAAVRPLVLFDLESTRVSHTPDSLADFPASLPFNNVQRGYAAYVVFPRFGSATNQPVHDSVAKLWATVTYSVTRRYRVELTTFPWESDSSASISGLCLTLHLYARVAHATNQ